MRSIIILLLFVFTFISFQLNVHGSSEEYKQDLVSRCNQLAMDLNIHESSNPIQRSANQLTFFDVGASLMKNFFNEFTKISSGLLNFFADKTEYKYYYFIPVPVTSVLPSQKGSVSFITDCFSNNIISNVSLSSEKLQFTLTVSGEIVQSDNSTCKDFYLFAASNAVQFHYLGAGSKTFTWDVSKMDSAELWDLNTFGLRFLTFPKDPQFTVYSIIETALLFEPEIFGPAVNPIFGNKNAQFLRTYPQFPFPERSALHRFVNISEDSIKSGDFIGITRMDGLDPMIIWGMGGTTGHTTVALWFEDGLYITESQVKSAYWPNPNIQRTPYQQWVQYARDANYNFVHVPLSDEASSKFNETAAREFFFSVEGYPYGYHNFLFGWIDTPEDNFPCLPPDYKYCLTSEALMVVAELIDKAIPALGDKFYNQAFYHRLNLNWNDRPFNSTTQIIQYSYSQGINFGFLISLPEQDSWIYNDGPSMVCDVFVCSVWKAAGLFKDINNQIQCTELTPADVYQMNFFVQNEQRPRECQIADPDLPYCQIDGKYQLQLPLYNTVTPYPNMGQRCPTRGPDYNKPAHC